MSEEDDSEKVGFRRPPKAGQFKPRQSGNPRGSRKRNDWDVAAILDEEVEVRVGSRMRKMSGFELTARGLIKRALEQKNLQATIDFLRLCERYKAMRPPSYRWPSVVVIPFGWDMEEFKAMLAKHGLPPWTGPRSGLTEADEKIVREYLEAKKQKKSKKPAKPRTRAMILEDLLNETHSVSENGRPRRRSTRFLTLRVLRSHSISGNPRAARVVEDFLERYGRSEQKPQGGFLLVPETPSTPEQMEAYLKEVEEQQAPFRSAEYSKTGKYEK